MGLNEEQRRAVDDWFDVVVVDIQCMHPSAQQLMWGAVLQDEAFGRMMQAKPAAGPQPAMAAVAQLRALREHPCPQNRRYGCPGLPEVDGAVQYYTPDGRLESEPVGLLSLTPFNGTDTTKAVTRDDVLTYVKWRVDREVQKLGADRPALDPQGLHLQAKSVTAMLQALLRRREERHQQEIEALRAQVTLHLASLGRVPNGHATPPPNPTPAKPPIPGQPNGAAGLFCGGQPRPNGVADAAGVRLLAPADEVQRPPSGDRPAGRETPPNGPARPNNGAVPAPAPTPALSPRLAGPSPGSNAGSSPRREPSPTPGRSGYEVIGDHDDVLRQQAEGLRELRQVQEQQLARDRVRPPVVPESVGLENPVGAHNCFLNVVLQSLWHLGDFRRLVEELPKHQCRPNCIFCAICNLFTQYKFGNYAHMPPKEVREVVSRIFSEEHRFQMDQMDDAAEMLDAILQQLHLETGAVADPNVPCQPPCISHAVFAAEIIERSTKCPYCKDVGEHLNSYVTYLHYFPASLMDGKHSLEARLQAHLENEHRTCKGCQARDTKKTVRLPIHKHMCNLPLVFACVLAWAGEQSTKEVLKRVTKGIGQTLQLSQIFRVVAEDGVPLQPHVLRGMICFYGRHYMAYFWNRIQQQWVFIDDSNVRPVGDWATVRQTIIDGRQMPLVLFYVHGEGGQQRAASPNPPLAPPAPSSPPAPAAAPAPNGHGERRLSAAFRPRF